MPTVMPCERCGGDMPPLPDDLAAMLAKGVAVSVTHEDCANPSGTKPDPSGRQFEVAVSIREITETEMPDPGDPQMVVPGPPQVEELAAFRSGVTAPTLDAAMRPLAEALGKEWLKVEKHAGIADPRA